MCWLLVVVEITLHSPASRRVRGPTISVRLLLVGCTTFLLMSCVECGGTPGDPGEKSIESG